MCVLISSKDINSHLMSFLFFSFAEIISEYNMS